MNVRSWAVGVVSASAMVAGLVAVQSGVTGTTALPILPHRAVAPAPATGTELPAPAEVRRQIGAPAGVGTVRPARVQGPEAMQPSADPRPAADRPETRPRGEQSDDQPGDADEQDGAGPDAGTNSDPDAGTNSGPGSGTNSGPGSGDSGRDSGGNSGHDSGPDTGHDSHGPDGRH